jgi:hypothetical protein
VSTEPVLPKTGVRRLFAASPLTRVVGLWVLLIVLFLAIRLVLSNGSPHASTPAPEPADSGDFWTDSLVRLVPMVAVMGVLVGFIFWNVRRVRTYNVATASAQIALGEGDYAKAAAEYQQLARRYAFPRSLARMAKFNLAIAQMHAGELDVAIVGFVGVEAHARAVPGLAPLVADQLALAYALRGDFDAAHRWRAESENRGKGMGNQAMFAGLLAFADAILDVREGRCEALLRWLGERWHQLDGNVTARTMRPLRVLRAFALARSDGVRGAMAVDEALSPLRPARPGEFALLGAKWPEMQVFLATYGLD